MEAAELPAWNEHGLLPPGLHACSFAEFEQRLGAFQRSERRSRLCRKLGEYLDELRRAPWRVLLVIDGSFVMHRVDEPDDVDIVLVLPADWDMSAEVLPFEYNLLARKRVKSRYGFDLFAVRSQSPEEREWLDFFAQINPRWCVEFGLPNGLTKGLVALVP